MQWQLLTASKTITVHASDCPDPVTPIAEYNPHRGIVNSAVYNHTGKVIASCGQDGKIALHSAHRIQDKLLQFSYHSRQEDPSCINCCLFSPKSKFIAAGSVNSTVKVWDLKSNKQKQALHKLKGHAGAITSVAWINSQEIIASASTSGDILLHDVSTGAIRDSLTSRFQDGVNCVRVSEGDGFRRLAACTNSGTVMVWDVNLSTKKPIFTYEDPKKNSYTCLSVSSFNPALMVCSSTDSNLVFMDIIERRVIKNVPTQQPLTSIALHEDGQILAAGGMSGGLFIYDLRKIQVPLFKLNGHDTPVKSVFFSEKEKDKEKEKARLKEREFGAASNFSKTSSGEDKNKVVTQVIPKVTTVEDKDKSSRPVRNLTKKQETPYSKQQYQKAIQQQKPSTPPIQPIPQNVPTPTPNSSYTPTSTSYLGGQTTYSRTITTSQTQGPTQTLNSNYQYQQQPSTSQIKQLEETLLGEMRNMEMRMNQKFQMLHLEVIRQMQLSVERISNTFDKKISAQRELEGRIKQLQEENQQLKKRTF